MMSGLFPTLVAAAMTVGSLHSLAPDHWVPFAALARAQGWPVGRTARVTLLCGFGHVTVSVLLGLFAFRSIAHSVVLLVLLIGFGWLFRGLVRVISAIADKTTVARGWQIAEGLLGALAGVVILVWPAPSLQVLAWISGIILLLLGLIEVVAAFKVRRLA